MKDSGLTTEVQTSTRFTIVPLISISDQISVGNTVLVVRLTDIGMFEKNHHDAIGMLGLYLGGRPRAVHVGLGDHLKNTHSEGIQLLQKLRGLNLQIKSVTGLCVGNIPYSIQKVAHLKNSDAHVLIKETSLPRHELSNYLFGIVTKDITGKKLPSEEFTHLADLISKTIENCLTKVMVEKV